MTFVILFVVKAAELYGVDNQISNHETNSSRFKDYDERACNHSAYG